VAQRPRLWRCKACGRPFANRHQSHACGRFTLAHHFRGKPAAIRALFRAVVAVVRSNGPASPRNHLHAFRIANMGEIDDDFRAWIAEAYLVGEQQHLKGRHSSVDDEPGR